MPHVHPRRERGRAVAVSALIALPLLCVGLSVGVDRAAPGWDDYEAAVVISNDSDLKGPIEAVRVELGLPVGVVIPSQRVRRSALPADFHRRIRRGVLTASQFPDTVADRNGVIRRPRSW